ncbi:MAG: hypothetical protein IFNCLDLE_02696 [Ignavibacteriaceae bacterium]|nr:hypothetical protein [Ignavibacteriaceae bacterium]
MPKTLEEHNAKEISRIYDILISLTQRVEVLEHYVMKHIIPTLEKEGMLKRKK